MRSSLLLIIVAVLASHWWMVDAPFILDDYTQLAEAIEFDRDDVLLGGNRATSSIFRPVLYLTQRLDYEVWGISRTGHHVSSILYHLATCVALFVFLRELLAEPGRHVALAAALLFAVHPAKYEAVVWLAARTSLLPGLFGLLAALALLRYRRGSAIAGALVFVFLLAAFWSKESAVAYGAALAVLDALLLHRGARCTRPGKWPFTAALAIAPAVFWGTRRWMFGSDATQYLGWNARVDGNTVTLALENLPRMVADILGGTASMTPGTGTTMTIAAAALVLAGIAALPPRYRGARVLRGSASLAFAFVAVALPTAFVVLWGYLPEPGAATFVSRFSYSPAIVVCVALAFPFASLGSPGGRRLVAAAYVMGLATWMAGASFAEYRRLGERTIVEDALLADLAAAVAGAPDTVIAVEGLPGWMMGMTWKGIGPPFHERALALVEFPEDGEGVRRLVRTPHPVLIGRWDETTRRAVFDDPPSPPRSAVPPAPRRIDPPAARVSLDGRGSRDLAVVALEVVCDGDLVLFDVVVTDVEGRELRVRSGRHALFAKSSTLLVPLHDRIELLRLGAPATIALESTAGGARIASFAPLRELPSIESLAPADGAVVRLTDAQSFVFHDPGAHLVYRVGLKVGRRIFDRIVPRSVCDVRDDGTVAIPFDAPDLRDPTSPTLVDALRHGGLDRLSIEWWVEGLDGNVFHAQARGPSRRLVLVR